MNSLEDSFKIGKNYQTLEYIGAGDTGIVYKGLNSNLNTLVAIKFLKPELTRSNKFISHLNQELQSVFELNHPNIVNVKELLKDGDKYYIIMEYVDGIDLRDILKNNDILPFETSINIVTQIAKGLEYSHSKEVIHRSLQPENIIVSKDKLVKIINFGISKAIANTWLTMTGTNVSNVEYMSPEQAEGELVDHRSDIYSLGIIAYELFTGQVPFKKGNQTILQLAMKHINSIPELPSKINKDIPSWIEDIIMKCIEKKPSDRFQSASDIIKAFENRDNEQKRLEIFISSKVENENNNIDMKELEHFLLNDTNDENKEKEELVINNEELVINNNVTQNDIINQEDSIKIDIQNEDNKIDNKENIKVEKKTLSNINNINNIKQIKIFLGILIILEVIIISIILLSLMIE
ncbi:MAG: hypothetical protein KatS3mg068_0040 [Candidatus Sericytochromatia bacterium]|nr:MAG: hypothetical protein KatS3mg068_0040 [Candidatus Sericytochromatia bacterium]